MAEEKTLRTCPLPGGRAPLPAAPVPGMSYVPFQQWNGDLYAPDRALEAGTLFPVLDKPFLGGRRVVR